MTAFPTIRVAAVQATPVILDAEASIEKAVGLLADVAAAGAQLAVLPETFVSLYPSNAWAAAVPEGRQRGLDELWERMWASSVDVPGPLVDELVEACRATTSCVQSVSTSASPTGRGRSTTHSSSSGPDGILTGTAS